MHTTATNRQSHRYSDLDCVRGYPHELRGHDNLGSPKSQWGSKEAAALAKESRLETVPVNSRHFSESTLSGASLPLHFEVSGESSPLGCFPVTLDAAVPPEQGPLCLTSVYVLKLGFMKLLNESSKPHLDCLSQLTTTDSAIDSNPPHHSGESQQPHILDPNILDSFRKVFGSQGVLVITNFAGLKAWQKVCICPRMCAGRSCALIDTTSHLGTTDTTDTTTSNTDMSSGAKTGVVPLIRCLTYGAFNANSETLTQNSWACVVLEYSCSCVPFPLSHTLTSILNLRTRQWYTVNRQVTQRLPMLQGFTSSKAVVDSGGNTHRDPQLFNTHWEDIHKEALKKCSNRCLNVSSVVSKNFYQYAEPGLGLDPATESLNVCKHLLDLFHSWATQPDPPVRVSLPVLADGMWIIKADCCQQDALMLHILSKYFDSSSSSNRTLQEAISEYFQATSVTLDFANLACAVCGSNNADTFLLCCDALFHRDCLLNELKCDVSQCPVCGASLNFAYVENKLLGHDGHMLIKPPSTLLLHDWSCQVTRQIISTAVLEICETYPESKCLSARVHDGEPLTMRYKKAARVLKSCSRNTPRSPRGGTAQCETVYLWFITEETGVELFDKKASRSLDRHIVIVLSYSPQSSLSSPSPIPQRYHLRL